VSAVAAPSNVSVRGVDIAFGQVQVLKQLDLEVGQSEFLVMLGPSGCGKSTLLNAIAGLIEVGAGQIFIGDRNVTWDEPKDRGIAMVFQSYALYPRMTVRGNLSFGLKVARLSSAEIDRRVRAAAEMLRIGELLDRRPLALSGGQRQRVAIGRALVREAPVFLFDEPLSNLDAQLRAELRVEIKRLHQRIGATMIYVTHDQIEALTLADRIAVMQGGRIQQLDTPQAIYERPASLFVASFVGSPAMNFLPGCLVATNGAPRFEGEGFGVSLSGAPMAAPFAEGRAVTLGVRPEHVGLGASPGIPAAIELIEPMGADSLVWLRAGDTALSSRVSGQARLSRGESVSFSIAAEHISLFDAATGARL
jgi:multiple sugar transport system ATP-binding protein